MRANTDRAPGVHLVTDSVGRVAHTLPPVSPGEPIEPFDFEAAEDPRELVALKGRITAGLGVQLLVDLRTSETFITLALDGETETFDVPSDRALDAFEHPFAYGGTLL